MRTIAPALLLLMASCGQGERGANQVGAPANNARPDPRAATVPTIAIAATGPGGCTASWDGQPVTPAQITERSVAYLERVIAALGGPQNMTEANFPIPNVEAPAELSFACADTILASLQRSGMASVRLRSAGGAAVLADFPIDANRPPPPVPLVLGVGAGGALTWNDAPMTADALTARLGQMGSLDAPELGDEPPPGGLDLVPSREATFGQVHAVLTTINRYHIRPFLYLPSTTTTTSGSPPPSAPPPPPPPGG